MKNIVSMGLGIIAIFLVVYGCVAGYYWWKWETPHEPLPIISYSSSAESPYTSVPAQRSSKLLADQAQSLQAVSISGAMSLGQEVIWADAVGLSKVVPQTAATIKSVYRIGSVSKSVTSILLARMVDANMIDLDDPVQNYMPDFPTVDAEMTIRHLASHMAGIRHYGMDLSLMPPTENYSKIRYKSVMEAVRHFKNDGVEFSSGQDFRYSTYGYTLLSAVMEKAGGKPFLQLLDEMVFTPLQLKNIGAENASTVQRNLVEFYTSDAGLYGETPFVDLSNKWAGGGLVATPTDLVKLGGAFLTTDLVSDSVKETLLTVQTMPDGSINPQHYTLGWRRHDTINILGEDRPINVVHHGGMSIGAVAFFLLVPEFDISVALVSNSKGENTRIQLQLLAYKIAETAINAQTLE